MTSFPVNERRSLKDISVNGESANVNVIPPLLLHQSVSGSRAVVDNYLNDSNKLFIDSDVRFYKEKHTTSPATKHY